MDIKENLIQKQSLIDQELKLKDHNFLFTDLNKLINLIKNSADRIENE